VIADSLARAAAEYLTLRMGPITLAPAETTIVVIALAAALVAGFNLWRIDRREQRVARLASLRVGTPDSERTAGETRIPWYRRLGGIVAASPIVGAADRAKLLQLLDRAGIRAHGRLANLLAAKVCAAFGLAVLSWLYIEAYQLFTGSVILRLVVPCAGFFLGLRLPDMILSRIAARRRLRLEIGMPDALDLLVVCAEAGLSLNQAIDEVSRGMRGSNPTVADEFALTAAEMRVQADVEAVIDNMVRRTGIDSLNGIMATLKQSLRFGTPLAESLRLLAGEMRAARQARMEERAARLPVLLAIPIMLFILPSLLMVIGTPVALRIMDTLGSVFGHR
jgi:tight adherence protein C